MTWQFTLTGLLIGGLVGLTGMGGGSLLTPILVIVFGFKPTYAVGTDILHGAIFKSFGAARHRRLGTVHARLASGCSSARARCRSLGVALATWLTNTYGDGVQSVEAYAIGAALVLGGIGLVAKTLVKLGMQPDDAPLHPHPPRQADRGWDRSGLRLRRRAYLGRQRHVLRPRDGARLPADDRRRSSVPTSFTPRRCSGSPASATWSPAMSTSTRWSGCCSARSHGVLLTSNLTLKLPEEGLRLGLAGVLILSGIKLIDPPGANWILLAGLAVCAVALTAWGARALTERRRLEQQAPATDLPLR